MVGDPRDRRAYAIAIAMLGLAFVVAVAGVCWIVADHEDLHDSHEIWFLPAVIGGVFVGSLISSASARAKWLVAVGAVGTGFAGALDIEDLVALCVTGAALGGVFFGLFIPSPARREP